VWVDFAPPIPERTIEWHQTFFERRNEMLGMGLVGTIIVVVLIVWLVRRV
jgi:hypothetical protein